MAERSSAIRPAAAGIVPNLLSLDHDPVQAYHVRVHPSAATPPREQLLAWRLAEVASGGAALEGDVLDMIINRILDNTGVAVAGLARRPVANSRAQAAAHPNPRGATIYGLPATRRASCEWAAWANATAVRELDFHDTFLAVDFNHPGDMISALLAVGQQRGVSGMDLARGIATAYEVDVCLTKAIGLNQHRIDHVTHLAAGAVAGIGSMLRLPVDVIYQAINHAVHVNTATRQSRKGEISSWKAYAPAHTCKTAIEAVDRAMRGESGPAPIYEGDDGIIAWLLDGIEAQYTVHLPDPDEPRRAILETYTKAYSAEYQAQALIDLAFRMRSALGELSRVNQVLIHTSDHTHRVIGNGSNDQQKYDPAASRETLDHSAMYIFAVVLEDGTWHHDSSYAPERARHPATVDLWRRIRTAEDPEWTRRYHAPDPADRWFGARAVVSLDDGSTVTDEISVADAHPNGAKPFARDDYLTKFRTLVTDIAAPAEAERFVDTALGLERLTPGRLTELSVEVPAERREIGPRRGGFF